MKNRNEKGITMITLVITIIIMGIIAGIGIAVGTEDIDAAKYMELQAELKIMQTEINKRVGEDIGATIPGEYKGILNVTEVNNELVKKAENSGKSLEQIKNGFKLCTAAYITQELDIDGIESDFLVNTNDCIVISTESLLYNNVNYYMLEQIKDALYNVTYNNQISSTGTFSVETNTMGNTYEIVIKPEHNKYVSKWQVKYRLKGADYWETTNQLRFVVEKRGNYEIHVYHGEEVDLGTQTVKIPIE